MTKVFDRLTNIPSPDRVKQALRQGRSPGLKRRRRVVSLSLIGIGSMIPVTLYQTGIIRHLPDPPLRLFDSDKVNLSNTAFALRTPDGPLSIVGHAVNIVLAGTAADDRARDQSWLPPLASLIAGLQAAVALKYLLWDMPVKEKKLCGYCIVDACAHIAVFVLTAVESQRAIRSAGRSQ